MCDVRARVSCVHPLFPQLNIEHTEVTCYAACPEHHQMRCEEGTCACFSCAMQANWPPEADVYSEIRGVPSVLKAQCPDALAHPGALLEDEAFFVSDKGMPPPKRISRSHLPYR